jgi:hypothetical protein
MRLVAWFLFGFIGTAAYGLAMNAIDIPVWPVVAMALIVGSLLMRVPALEVSAVAGTVTYAALFAFAYLRSFEPLEVSERMQTVVGVTRIGLIGAILIAGGITLKQLGEERIRRGTFLLAALAMGALIAYVSGNAGSATPMRGWLSDYFSPEVVEAIVWTFRKSVHVVFYGVMAFCLYRAARGYKYAAILAAVFALTHGVFDEIRQSTINTRYGTPIDLLFDGAGVTIALAIAKRKRR